MNIAGLSIRRPVFVVMIIASIVTLGIISYLNIPVDLLPNIERPSLYVSTQYTGASAEDVENIVTKPLENALGTVEGLDTISSQSREGRSQVTLNFKLGTDVKFAELKVIEKVQQAAPTFPDGVDDPRIRRFSSDDTPIMFVSILGPKPLPDLKDIVENDVQPALETVEGVGSVSVFGGQSRIVTVSLNESLLSANGVSYKQVKDAIAAKNVSLPVGSVRGENKNMSVRVLGRAESVDDIADIQFTSATGKQLRVRDVAEVALGLEDEDSRARVNGRNAVLFAVSKQSGSNTVRVAEAVHREIDALSRELPGGVSLKVVNDTSVAINRSISGVRDDILIGAVLAVLIVLLFLGNLRSTVITAAVLPNCLLGAFFLSFVAGFSLNTMTLLALSIAVGLLVDDAIVVRENIYRHLELGKDPKTAATDGTNEVGLAVLSTTLTILAVFVPLSFMQGQIGQLFKEFGLTVAFALVISLVDAFTAAPMLSAYWHARRGRKRTPNRVVRFFTRIHEAWNRAYEKISGAYRRVLAWGLDHKFRVIAMTLGLFSLSIVGAQFLGSSFMASGDAGSFSVDLEAAPGAPLDYIDSYVRDIEGYLATLGAVENFFCFVGRGSSNRAEINVDLKAMSERGGMSTRDVMGRVRQYIGRKFEKFLTSRLNERNYSLGFGWGRGGGGVSLSVRGKDLKTLSRLMDSFSDVLSRTPGISDVDTSLKPGEPELVLRLDKLKAEKLGINETWLAGFLRDLIQGTTVSQPLSSGGRDYFIVIRLAEGGRDTESDVRNLLITTPTGRKVPLAALVSFSVSASPREIRRESKSRVVRITGNIEPGYSYSDVAERTRRSIEQSIVRPAGYDYDFTGQQDQLTDLRNQIVFAIGLALLFMYMILASLYNSFVQPFVVMLTIPLAVIGAFLALLVFNLDLDIYGYIGLLLVLGLVTKNAILVIDFSNQLRKGGATLREAILTAGPIRLRPILMTSFSTIFGMLPLALGLNEGASGRQGLPLAVIGGMLTSTFLTLIVIPVVYEAVEKLFEKAKKKRQAADGRACHRIR
ncbi:MAG: efflux RND transporter permease subunit [Spirochaetales bacterium]|nr:efflux RND transporter permease subunit [Spirochaetales bacterium]